MPELPEVETVVRSLASLLVGQRIQDAEFRSRRVARQDWRWLQERLVGRRIKGLTRRAKFILIELDQGILAVHLGMTGRLLWNATETPYTRAVLLLSRGRLLYDDVRQFGRIEWGKETIPRLERLGPEPLNLSFEEFFERLRRRKARLKPLLLNQSFLAGLGNIYADESLFRARIHPLAAANRLGRDRAFRLYRAIQEVLAEAIRRGGSTIADYVDGVGQAGFFQLDHRVYGRQGEPCLVCGSTVRRLVAAQRSAHFCPQCQRR